ncbi:linear amide C-N hydrolase [Aquamicrobium segne]|uniref:Linear amide C-N hydrolase n=1 Tax=Aquamicrobium segne TaxID=469547 RepID=A0ABW0H3M0_9HYPH
MDFLTSLFSFLTHMLAYQPSGEFVMGCTALLLRSTEGNAYAGRTMELSAEMPYVVASMPKGQALASQVDGHEPLHFTTRYGILAIAVPYQTLDDLKIVEGLNEKGLTFSVLAYGGASGPRNNGKKTQAMLAAIDLGAWLLGLFANIDEVKQALSQRNIVLTALAPLHGAKTPFHFVVHDASGASLVIEFSNGAQHVYDNPVGVMTNGPDFPWHLTNLGNYTFLNNQDRSTGRFGTLDVEQPDAGIATAGLPSSNTSVGRFVRAAYYATYAGQTDDQNAIRTLAHIMNTFDRPKGTTLNSPSLSGLDIEGATSKPGEQASEYTSWTVLADLAGSQIYIRSYDVINFIRLDLRRLLAAGEMKVAPLGQLSGLATLDATDALLGVRT